MRRFLFQAQSAAALVLLTTWLIAGEANPPAQSASKAGEDDVQDFVFLAEARPLLVRLHVRVDGKPLPAVWDAFMKHVFTFLDVNGDGVLSQQEAERAPRLGSGQGGLGGFLQGGSPKMKELDTDKDGKVSLAELSASYRKNGFVPFQFQLDMSPPAANAMLALYMGGTRPDPEVAALSKAIFALLDTDKDGKLTQKELDAAPALLLAKDENEDEIITGQELVPQEKPKGNMLAMMAMAIPKNANVVGNKYLVPIPEPAQAPPELASRMAERYDPGAKKPFAKLSASSPKPQGSPSASSKGTPKETRPAKANDKSKESKKEPECKLSRKQLGLDEATFARLDANKDGVLDNKELAAFVRRDPDLCFVVSFGDKADNPLALGTVAGKPTALAGEIDFQDSVSLVDLGKTRLELRRDADKRTTNRYLDFIKPQFRALFKSADKDNNGYLDEKEAKKGPFFSGVFKQMDRDGDGKVTEKELLAFFDNMMDLENRAKNACVTLVLRDQSRGLFDLLDSDRDGRLSVREINQAPKLLARSGSKGFLRKEDIPPCYQLTLRRGPARPGGSNQEDVFAQRYFSDYEEEQAAQPGPAWFRKMDRNRDGDVSRKEFLFSDELFRKIDSDGDGLISRKEAEKAGVPSENKAGSANPSTPATPTPAERGEDAESFLPNAVAFQDATLTVGSVAFSPDGKRLAMGAGWVVGQPYGEVRLWDVEKNRMIATVQAAPGVRSVAFSPDGKNLASGELDGTVKLHDPNTGEVRATLSGHKIGVNSVAFSPDSKSLAVAGLDNFVTVWDVAARKQRLRLQGHTDRVVSVAFAPDGKTLVSSSHDQNAILWNLETGKIKATLAGHSNYVETVTFSPDGKTVATASWDGTVKLWDAAAGTMRSTLSAPGPMALCVAFSPDGKILAASGGEPEGKVKLWDAATLDELAILENKTQDVWSVAFSPDSKRLATGSTEGTVKLWDVAARKELTTVEKRKERRFEPQPVLALAYAPDGKSAAIAGEDGGVQVIELPSGIQRHVLKGHADVVTCLAYSPDGKLLASGSPDSKIKLWDAATGKEIRTLAGHASWIYALAFAPDGKTLASGSYDRTVRLWDVASGQSLRVLKGHKASVRGVAFAPDGKTLASGGSDRTIKVWDSANGELRMTLKGHEGAVRAVAFSADGKTLASAGEDNNARLWDAAKGVERAVLRGHNDEVTALAFSPHGLTLATGSLDSTIRVWDPETGKLRTTLQAHPEGVAAVAIAPNGQQLLSGGRGKSVKLWPGTPPTPFVVSPRLTLTGHKGQVWFAVPSPDGKRLVSGGDDGTARLWDLRSDAVHLSYALPDAAFSMEFSPDGRTLAASCINGSIHLVDLATGKASKILTGHSMPVVSVAFSPDGKKLLSSAGLWRNQQQPGEMKLWDVASGKELVSFTGHEALIPRVAISPDGKTAASASLDRTARLWDLASGKELFVLRGHNNGVRSLQFTADGKKLLTGSWDRSIKIWDVTTGKELRSVPTTLSGISCLALSPDGKTVAVSENSGENAPTGRFQILNLESGAMQTDIRLPMGRIVFLAFAPDGKSLAVAGGNLTSGEVSLWDTSRWHMQARFPRFQRFVESVAFSRDGKRLAARGLTDVGTNGVTVWELAAAAPQGRTFQHTGSAMSATLSPDGKLLVLGLSDGTVLLSDAQNGTLLGKLTGHTAQIRGVAFSPDGKTLATASNDNSVRLWDVAKRESKAVLDGHQNRVMGVVFTPDGKTLISVGWDQMAKVWDASTGAERTSFRVQAQVWNLALSPDGKTLATASGLGNVKLYDVAGGKELRTLAHPPHARGLAFSPDGKLLAAGNLNGVIKLWSVADGRALASLEGHKDLIFSLRFSPDGRTLMSASKDETVRLWQVMTKDSAPTPIASR